MSMMGVPKVAERLGVTTRQVQHLVSQGELRQVATGLVDAGSVDRLISVRRGSRTRAWSEVTAWGAIALLSDGDAAWLGESQRSRLRGRLRTIDVDDLIGHTQLILLVEVTPGR